MNNIIPLRKKKVFPVAKSLVARETVVQMINELIRDLDNRLAAIDPYEKKFLQDHILGGIEALEKILTEVEKIR